MVDVVQNVKYSFFSRKRDACDGFPCRICSNLITQSGRFHPDASLKRKPADDEKLMNNETGLVQSTPSATYKEGAVVFPVLHGPREKRFIQGLEVLKTPYVASSVAPDKITTNGGLGVGKSTSSLCSCSEDGETAAIDSLFRLHRKPSKGLAWGFKN